MKMKSLIIFFLLLSVSLSFGHGQVMKGLHALGTPTQGAPALKAIQPHPPSQSGMCSTALKTCSPRQGFPGGRIPRYPFLPGVSSECCDAVRKIENADRQCFPYGYIFHRIISSCRRSHPIPSPPPAPATPASASCPFVDSCNVKFKGFFPSYNINNPDCCKIVKGISRPQGQCLRYIPILYRIRYECYLPPRGRVPPQQPSPPLPPPKNSSPPQAPPTSPSTPSPAVKPIQPPSQAPPLTPPPAIKPIQPPQAPPTLPPPAFKPIQPPPQAPSTSPSTPPPAPKPIQPPPQVPPTTPSPAPKPIQPPPPQAPPTPPTSPSCAFIAACNVKSNGSSYSYSFNSPDCCRIVRGIDGGLDAECSMYTGIFNQIRNVCYFIPPTKT